MLSRWTVWSPQVVVSCQNISDVGKALHIYRSQDPIKIFFEDIEMFSGPTSEAKLKFFPRLGNYNQAN